MSTVGDAITPLRSLISIESYTSEASEPAASVHG